jgi:hypothetical protein
MEAGWLVFKDKKSGLPVWLSNPTKTGYVSWWHLAVLGLMPHDLDYTGLLHGARAYQKPEYQRELV